MELAEAALEKDMDWLPRLLQELLGQAGGPVRRPMLDLTEAEKAATRAAFEACGLKLA